MKVVPLAVGTFVLGLIAGSAMAQMTPADKTFATKAAAGGLAEVTMGQMAVQQAGDGNVKDFGRKMVSDHSMANRELLAIAKNEGLILPSVPDPAGSSMEQKLRTLKGKAFDEAYMRGMTQDHRQDVAEFRQEAETGKNPALKNFALKYLPTLEQHLQLAESVQPK